jgi:hypothetical protein
VCAKASPMEDNSKQVAKNSFRVPDRLMTVAVHFIA